MRMALAGGGLLLLAAVLVDVTWTTMAPGSGAGPLTDRLTKLLWRGAHSSTKFLPRHRTLAFAGVFIVFSVLASWIILVSVGWLLIYSSADGAVLDATTGAPGDLVNRVYFTGYSVFTLGLGDYVPGDGLWQVATVIATGTGLVLVTLSITYLVPVASAATQRRQLAAYVSSLGESPEAILERSWTGSSFGSLDQHLGSLVPMVHMVALQHLTYPVLHYLHSNDPRRAAAPAITTLSQTVFLLRHAVAPDARPDALTLRALDTAIEDLLAAAARHAVRTSPGAVPAPSLDDLRDAAVPTVDETAYGAAIERSAARRGRLADYLADDGWELPAAVI